MTNNYNFSEQFQSLAGIATNLNAYQILQQIYQPKKLDIWLPDKLNLNNINNAQFYHNSLKEHLINIWDNYNAFIFCLATGAVVRLIADLLKNKQTDPAILVIDEHGKYIVSLVGGHQGGADILTRIVAHQLDAIPILTGSSNCQELSGIDILGKPYGWVKGSGNWTEVSAAISRQKTVQIIQECGSTLWQNTLPENHNFYFGFPDTQESIKPQGRIWISTTKRKFSADTNLPKVQWHPRILWVGIGCERNTSKNLINTALQQTFKRYHLATESIAGIATIDIKADEIGIIKLCQENNYPLEIFSAETLSKIEVPNPSQIVNQEVNTPSVAEAAALCAANKFGNFNIARENKNSGLLVPKQIIKIEGEKGAVTVAIAQAELEYIGHHGKLFLVGIGPGNLNQITPAAKGAIAQADVIVGYSLYIDLIKPLFRPGQIIESLPITKERERAQRAIELAQWGLTVTVISSGDCGIYGMAGLVLEELALQGWNGETPTVEVFPGISALQSSASLVGAPLMHDFCAISLSDLLTPWAVIEKRLKAAAMGDFVTIFYNPKSKTRSEQIGKAREIFLEYRDSNTPVALINSAYRENEQITITTLEKMLDCSIDMLTTVIIGNCSTRNYHNWMITPRGYLGFES